jgi:alpha-1,3-glucan synthase
LLWGEEQSFYVLDNTASNYIFGRQAMSSASAWQTHGCYSLDSTQYFDMPLDAARNGCHDETVSHDHRDPSHPIRNIIRHMYQLREDFPILNDGFFLQQLSNQTEQILYPGSSGVQTETGLWSVMRSQFAEVQQLEGSPVWLVSNNLNVSKTWQFDCANNKTNLNITALIAPYDSGTTVKNLFYPYDEHTLIDSARSLGINGSTNPNGCLKQLKMKAYGFAAYVPTADWLGPKPMITKFSPGHDSRIVSKVRANGTETVDIELQFSVEMSCESVTSSISFDAATENGNTPSIDEDSVRCSVLSEPVTPDFVGAISSTWSWSATLRGVENGVHAITVKNATSENGAGSTNSVDKFLFRIGDPTNPIVFPRSANYSTTLLSRDNNDRLLVNHSAAGADMWRYSTNFATTFSNWMPYEGGVNEITEQNWSGTELQSWKGDHVRVEYFSRHAGSSDHVQQGDFGKGVKQRRFPHLFLNGPYNQYGYDAGLGNEMSLSADNTWSRHWQVEWSNSGTLGQINVWGINPDGKPDQTMVMGDADGDSVLDRLPPSSLSSVVLNVTKSPPRPYLGWRVVIDDGSLRFRLLPSGSMWTQLILYILLWTVPVITAAASTWAYMGGFYKVKFNQFGASAKGGLIPLAIRRPFQHLSGDEEPDEKVGFISRFRNKSKFLHEKATVIDEQARRRTVLIATMEYDIEDWAVKVKIGGLGVMAQLMGKNLSHQDLIWVVPCVGDLEYPVDTPADPMNVTILGTQYEIKVQYHILRNITFVCLDAPVFRQQTKSEPYPARMDDMTSAIYYSAWNQCIAQAMERFPIDLYHINDYHGSVAPLYLLPKTIPAALSLHNAEFQGLWPMRTKQERDEVCSVFNLPQQVVTQYIQFGEVFNLLHAGASYLRVHQEGFGSVGVSKKYGKRSFARYPIFWGLKKVGALPNPDPSDTGEWDKKLPREEDIHIDPAFEAQRPELRRQAQEWAGLEQNPKAELFVFVGRWSAQKGLDLIADVFPAIIEAKPNVQLICVGPVIDLYGKFAALKLDRMMELYPGRVCSKPVFTALPSFIFSGAEFALIPSRDEPFGLVAVEFGRKGALGVGARVGGLGQMPGWWSVSSACFATKQTNFIRYTVESTTTSHLTHQFRQAIDEALSSKTETRAMMRARSSLQRFPVAQWVEDLEILQSMAIRIHDKVEAKKDASGFLARPASAFASGANTGANTPSGARTPVFAHSRDSSYSGLQSLGARLRHLAGSHSRVPSHDEPQRQTTGLSRSVSLGSARGPGHVVTNDHHDGIVERTLLPPIPDIDGDGIGLARAVLHDREDDDVSMSEDSGDGDGEQMTMMLRDRPRRSSAAMHERMQFDESLREQHPQDMRHMSQVPASPGLLDPASGLLQPPRALEHNPRNSMTPSMLSTTSVVGEKNDFYLQKVDPFFTDSNGEFYNAFKKKLEGLNGSNSGSANSIEEFLVKSEKKWFENYRNAKLGRYHPQFARSSITLYHESRPGSIAATDEEHDHEEDHHDPNSLADQFLLGKDYIAPTGLRKWMQIRIGDWPVYAFLLGLGQIISANSYQITLLTGEIGQPANKLYVIASIYLATSIMWWFLFRRFSSMLCLSLPWFFYGLAFLLIGTAHYASTASGTGWIQNVGTGMYAVASSSGSIFFALNFGDEGGAQVKSWVFRACVIQGTQQIYIAALWYWGSVLSRRSTDGVVTQADPISSTWKITAITLPIAFLLWGVGLLMWFGLPTYYRQSPGKMPSFYRSLGRRKIVMWFFVTVVIQNFFLSAPYGRNWTFLWSSRHTATWQIVLLILFFFVGVWAAFLWIFGHLSKSHSWILPLFAIGLGAPRWAQIWWGTSNIGLYLPWAGGYTASALISRSLWLWLGTLDAIQGVGLGMILLGTLTRVHVAFTLICAQVLGSIATIVARAVAPNKIGPGPISPDISGGIGSIWQAWFWVGLVCNLLICLGFYKFYRKEQLQKP